MLVAPDGEVVVEAGTDPEVIGGAIEAKMLEDARAQNPSLANRRL
jgi:hypothetical protein